MFRSVHRFIHAALPALLVATATLGVDMRPAAAFASTGTIKIEGYYSYSYDPYYDAAHLYVSSRVCTDTWGGTTSASAGAGATCNVALAGTTYYWGEQAGFRIDVDYRSSAGWQPRLLLHAGYASYAGPATGTGTFYSADGLYQGPAAVTYHLTPTYTCVPSCTNGMYAYGEATATIEYAIH